MIEKGNFIVKAKLKDVVCIITDKKSSSLIDVNNYVSTENILPNREGIRFPAKSFPRISKILSYQKNDVLVSNIRPYFKKIWFSDRDGVRSNDVLAFRTKNSNILLQKYLYLLLQSDKFFDYVTLTAKGTKMPRGDKKAILNFTFELPSISTQKKLTNYFFVIESLIKLNNLINDNLLELMDNLFYNFFPQINVGDDLIGSFIQNYDRFRKPLSKEQRSAISGKYRYIGAASVMDYINKYNFDGIYLLLGEDGTVIDNKGYPILQYVFGKFWPNNHTHVLKGKNISTEWLYLFFRQRKVLNIVTGAVQKKISQKNLNSLKFSHPNKEDYLKFNEIIQPLFSDIRIRIKENKRLHQLKQELLKQYF